MLRLVNGCHERQDRMLGTCLSRVRGSGLCEIRIADVGLRGTVGASFVGDRLTRSLRVHFLLTVV